MGVGVITCGQALYQSLELPFPGSGKAGYPILIYGGSTATGSLAIQYALHSGCFPIVVTCSERNFPFVKSLGATEAFDYNDPECGKKVLSLKFGRLRPCVNPVRRSENILKTNSRKC